MLNLNNISFESSKYSIPDQIETKQLLDTFKRKYFINTNETNKHELIKTKKLKIASAYSRKGLLRNAELKHIHDTKEKISKENQRKKIKRNKRNDMIIDDIQRLISIWEKSPLRHDMSSLYFPIVTDKKHYLVFTDVSDTRRPDYFLEDSIQSYIVLFFK